MDSQNIRKHKNDIFRLSALLTPETKIMVNHTVWNDLQAFWEAMKTEVVDTKHLGITRSKDDVLMSLKNSYTLK